MRFQVPQFIEVEDKIVGPLTLKQFIYLAGAGGICVVLYTTLPGFLAIFFMLPVAALGGALAFLKINNRSFIEILEAFFKFTIGGKLYLWKQRHGQEIRTIAKKDENKEPLVPRLSGSKLKELTWSLDVKEHREEIRRYKEGKQ